MKKLILAIALAFSSASPGLAQANEATAEFKSVRGELVKQQRLERSAQERMRKDGRTTEAVFGLTDAEVGESGSFNKNAKFFGTATAGFVLVSSSCDPVDIGTELGPDDRCLEVTDPSTTTIGVFNDIGRITLPAKQAANVVYMIGNNTTSFVFQNGGPTVISGLANYTPSITIESEALNDPAAIDPNTNLPMAGSYTTTNMGTKSVSKSLPASSFEVQTESYSRANTNGLSRTFWTALGLPPHVVDNLFKKPMTIKLNVTVRVRNVADGTFLYSTRLFAQ